MSFKIKLKESLQSQWAIAIFLLAIFLLTNGYIYGWDDQHLEIPLLKSLIDSDLYRGDYYVEALKSNFPSYFYRLLALVIKVDQIPAVYFILYLISRYFLFFWMYKFWLLITKEKFAAATCVVSFILLLRVEEFLYRTFSHQEFALAILMAALYLFYKERFVLMAALLGLTANIHAVYSLFIMTYLCCYFILDYRRHRLKPLLQSVFVCALFALPTILPILKKFTDLYLVPNGNKLFEGWYDFYLIACPQNFIFQDISLDKLVSSWAVFFKGTHKFLLLLVIYIVNIIFHKNFREDKKVQAASLGSLILFVITFVFTYFYPVKSILDLNLYRVIQYLQFFLFGYTTLLVINIARKEPIVVCLLASIVFSLLRFTDTTAVMAVLFLTGLLFIVSAKSKEKTSLRMTGIILSAFVLILCLWGIVHNFQIKSYSMSSRLTLFFSGVFVVVNSIIYWLDKNKRYSTQIRNLFVIIPLVAIFVSFCQYHLDYLRVSKTGQGFWQLQRNWIDMQEYVKEHTPKDALILVPHDTEMGGFRIHSEREIVCSYRDLGLIGFSYAAAVEWRKRLEDIAPFQVYIQKDIEPAIKNAILKYKVNYIVFMRYAEPQKKVDAFEKIYNNTVFSLYRVRGNPIRPNL